MLGLKIYLWKKRIPPYQAAKQLGISRQYFSDIVLGKRKAWGVRHRMVEELGFPASVVYAGTKKKGDR